MEDKNSLFTSGFQNLKIRCLVWEDSPLVFLNNLLKWVEDMVVEPKEGEENLIIYLKEDEVMEGENLRIEPSRIERFVREDKVVW